MDEPIKLLDQDSTDQDALSAARYYLASADRRERNTVSLNTETLRRLLQIIDRVPPHMWIEQH